MEHPPVTAETMKPEVITAIIAAIVAVISASLTVYGQARVAQLSDRLAKQREAESREAQTLVLMSKYRDPLLRSAIDLQSRLYNIHKHNILQRFDCPTERHYLIYNTLYVIAEYFGWVEILRRDIQFLDLGDLDANRQLGELFVRITKSFANARKGNILRLFNGEQRAIGEIMMTPRLQANGYECIGYAAFIQQLDHPEFARWFTKLKSDVETMVAEPGAGIDRLLEIHSHLIDLIDFLDPHCVRVPAKYRTRL